MRYALRQASDSLYVDIEGEFTFNDSDRFGQFVRDVQANMDPKTSQVRLNMDNLTRMDASAMDMLLSALDVAKRNHFQFMIENPHGQVETRLKKAAMVNKSLRIIK